MKRLLALDALRGFTVACMILVNVPGSWSHVYAPLLHAEWNGLTLADFVFPFFIFIMGVSIILAFTKAIEKGTSKAVLTLKVWKRSGIIFALGIVLNLISYQFQEFRIPGVLQRIALVYLAVGLLFLHFKTKSIYILGASLLVAYWLLMTFVPIPGASMASLEPGENWSNYIDSILIPFKQYGGTWDPEGILSTLPAICSAILGLRAGELILKNNQQNLIVKKLSLEGLVMILLGAIWAFHFPINKNLWTSSYVLVTAGIATVILASFIYLMDIKKHSKWATPGMAFGANALSAYIFHYLLIIPLSWISIHDQSIQEWFMYLLPDLGLSLKSTSLLWALLFIVICYLPIKWMYNKKIYIKV